MNRNLEEEKWNDLVSNMGSDFDVDTSKIEGMVRKIKRGRRMKSVAKESGIGCVELEGGTILEDNEIRAYNSQFF